jgi:hypothetical protein
MSRLTRIAVRRSPRASPGLEPLEARQVPSSLYPPDPCAAAARAYLPPEPI